MKNITPKAAFSLNDFKFIKVKLDYTHHNKENKINVIFEPAGTFINESKSYELHLHFSANEVKKGKKVSFFETTIVASFCFESVNSLDDIPEYFYANSLAIIYPYIRAFVSSISLQSNVKPLILPTLNLGMLKDVLKAKSKVQ